MPSESNDCIASWLLETRARDWVPPPPNVLLPTVPSHAVDLIVPSCSNIDQTSILATKQCQAAIELFRGIDVDKDAILSQEVSLLANRLVISLKFKYP